MTNPKAITIEQIREHQLLDDDAADKFAEDKLKAENPPWPTFKHAGIFVAIALAIYAFVAFLPATSDALHGLGYWKIKTIVAIVSALVAAVVTLHIAYRPAMTRGMVNVGYGLNRADADDLASIQKYVLEAPELTTTARAWLQHPDRIRVRDVQLMAAYVKGTAYARTVASMDEELAKSTHDEALAAGTQPAHAKP